MKVKTERSKLTKNTGLLSSILPRRFFKQTIEENQISVAEQGLCCASGNFMQLQTELCSFQAVIQRTSGMRWSMDTKGNGEILIKAIVFRLTASNSPPSLCKCVYDIDGVFMQPIAHTHTHTMTRCS